jgi:TATA-box binding protein (TBP) (component of TFIID and TFIIIB)
MPGLREGLASVELISPAAMDVSPRVTNYQIGFRASQHLLLRALDRAFHRGRFGTNIIRHDHCTVLKDTYTYLFYHAGFVNVTGIRYREEIPNAVHHLSTVFEDDSAELFATFVPWKVQNISASGKFPHGVHLRNLQAAVPTLPEKAVCSFHPERFAGCFVKFATSAAEKNGTICVFAGGSYFVVGARSEDRARDIAQLIHNVVRTQ